MDKAKYIARKLKAPTESFFLMGPRGTGKSTWLLHNYPDAERIDLLLGEEEMRYASHPERIRQLAAKMKPGSTLILDEVQRVARLLPEIHALIEEKKHSIYYDRQFCKKIAPFCQRFTWRTSSF